MLKSDLPSALAGPDEWFDATIAALAPVALVLVGGLGALRLLLEIEQARQCFRIRADHVRIVDRLQLLGRRQQQFLDDQPRDVVDAAPGVWRQRGGQAFQLRSSNRFEPLAKRDDRWNRPSG